MFNQDDIRIFLQDYPEHNRLLNQAEFDPEMIRKGIENSISIFNTIPPPIMTMDPKRPEDFPYKDLLLIGTTSYLLLGMGLARYRNKMNWSTDGVTIDDQAMADVYLQMGNSMKQEFKDGVKQNKVAENYARGWGSTRSDYSSLVYYRNDGRYRT